MGVWLFLYLGGRLYYRGILLKQEGATIRQHPLVCILALLNQPKSSKKILSRDTPRSSSILSAEAAIGPGPHI